MGHDRDDDDRPAETGAAVPVRVDLLGTLRIVRDGEAVEPAGEVRRTLLAVLAANAGDVVASDRLVAAAWGKNPPASAATTLRSHLSRLRHLLEPDRDAGAPSILVAADGGYRLDLDPRATDVGRFRAAVAAAESPSEWREAADLGRGTPLPGCADTTVVAEERQALREAHDAAVARCIRAGVEAGYRRLGAGSRALLRRLAVFRGSFDPAQARAVVGDVADPARVDATMTELVDHGTVVRESRGSPPTFRVPQPARPFLRAELDHHWEAEDVARRHRDWYLRWARQLPPGRTVLDLSAALSLARHREDLGELLGPNPEAAPEELVDLALLAAGTAFCPDGLTDAWRWLRQVRELPEVAGGSRAPDLLAASMLLALLRRDPRAARRLMERALDLYDGDATGLEPLVPALGMVLPDAAADAADRADALLADRADELRPDVLRVVGGMRAVAVYTETASPRAALDEAARAWSHDPWSELEATASWAVHAALLHAAGEHGTLAARLRSMQRLSGALGPPTLHLSVTTALSDAAAGRTAAGRDRLRAARDHHWARLPGGTDALLVAAAGIRAAAGERDRARRLVGATPDAFRHPATTIIRDTVARQLGLAGSAPGGDDAEVPGPTAAALLDDELGDGAVDG